MARDKGQIPRVRVAAFDAIADATRMGPVVIAVTGRAVRRQYQRAVARRGGNVGNLHFAVMPGMTDDTADALRRRGALAGARVFDVRELAWGGGQG
jgi:hypothetical protein